MPGVHIMKTRQIRPSALPPDQPATAWTSASHSGFGASLAPSTILPGHARISRTRMPTRQRALAHTQAWGVRVARPLRKKVTGQVWAMWAGSASVTGTRMCLEQGVGTRWVYP